MRYIFLLGVICFFCYIFLVGLFKDPTKLPSNFVNKKIPEFVAESLKKKNSFTNKDLDSKKTIKLVNFFASWCPPCKIEHPQLKYFAMNESIELFGINKKDKIEDLYGFLNKLGNPYKKIGLDPKGTVSIEWGVYGLPETFFIDKESKVRYRHVGPIMERDIKKIEKIIKKLNNE